MQIIFRQATQADFETTELLTRESFWDVYKPGADEHFVLHNLRKSINYIPALDLVAMEGETLIGHIICTKAIIKDQSGKSLEVVCAGPFCVSPDRQNQGIGSALIVYCISLAKEQGYAGMILFGNPDYYHRFGFRDAAEFDIHTKEGDNFDAFMAMELHAGSLRNIKGRFYEDEAFTTDPVAFEAFEKHFPAREKHVTPTQLKF